MLGRIIASLLHDTCPTDPKHYTNDSSPWKREAIELRHIQQLRFPLFWQERILMALDTEYFFAKQALIVLGTQRWYMWRSVGSVKRRAAYRDASKWMATHMIMSLPYEASPCTWQSACWPPSLLGGNIQGLGCKSSYGTMKDDRISRMDRPRLWARSRWDASCNHALSFMRAIWLHCKNERNFCKKTASSSPPQRTIYIRPGHMNCRSP